MPAMSRYPDDRQLLVDVHLPPEATAPGRARRALDPLEERFDRDTVHSLRLLISELVTNAVRHGHLGSDDPIELRVTLGGERVRVEVEDAGWGFQGTEPARDERPDDWPGGWGLGIVDAVADCWGVDRVGHTTVWFELPVTAG
jgi:anti-sigma regulatory factor (Ser/Thr protein kinase)